VSDVHRNVSSEREELILVDADDNETGFGTKADCHDGEGVLHRAFSLFLFNAEGELLLQQRGSQKRLWPGFWSNSCCSHPRRGETMPVATLRRLSDELNISAQLEYIYQFCYQAASERPDRRMSCAMCFWAGWTAKFGRTIAKLKVSGLSPQRIWTKSWRCIQSDLRRGSLMSGEPCARTTPGR